MPSNPLPRCRTLALVFLMNVGLMAGASPGPASADWYSKTIEHKQAHTVILDKEDIKGWPADAPDSDYRQFTGVTVGADNGKVLFSACVDYTATGQECRPFLVNPDGTGLQDASAVFPADLVSRSWGWGNMRINDDSSRFFVKVKRYEYLVIDETQVYYYDIPGATVGRAHADGFYVGSDWWFNINTTGSRFYDGKYDNGPSEGYWYTNFGGNKTLIFDVASLPCDPETTFCDHLNLTAFCGSSARNDRTFFIWTHKFLGNANTGNRSAMWISDLNGNKQPLTNDEHYWVWEGDWRGVSNETGTKALYGRAHTYGDPYEVYAVDVATGSEQPVTWSPPVSNYPDTFMTRSGRYVVAAGESGDAGFHYLTQINLDTGSERDTWSSWLPATTAISNITADDRYYYLVAVPPATSYGQLLYRADSAPQRAADFSHAPNISSIQCSAPALIHADGVTVAFTATVTDAQGLANIDHVRLAVLVDGREAPPWPMGRVPLAFPSGDPGSTLLYDDGTHGDEVAGDGIFTFDAVATRKGDYDVFNTWYTHFTLPHDVGIRVIAKDKDNNYTIADTRLAIAYVYADPSTLALKPGEVRWVDIFGASPPYTVTSSNPAVAIVEVSGTQIKVTAGASGKATLTIQDGDLNTALVTVKVSGQGTAVLPLLLLE